MSWLGVSAHGATLTRLDTGPRRTRGGRLSQLPLALRLAAHARLDTFVVGDNAAAVAHLKAPGTSASLWLWGPPNTGKSHLLQAVCADAHSSGRRTMYVPLALGAAGEFGPEMLSDLEALDLLALDDVQAVAGVSDWELALFRLFEAAQGRGFVLLTAARSTPHGCGFAMPDLASRAAAAVVYRVAPLDDAGRLIALQGHARHRGLDLEDAAARYLLRRARRDMSELCSCLDRLDRESLAAQRKLTIPFIRSALARPAR
jgi:DnaA-homolog protein